MLNVKKTAAAVFLLTSGAVFSGTMGVSCALGNVSVPCENRALDIGIQALYLKPVFDADFAYFASSVQQGVQHDVDANLNWSWGFQIDASYHFSSGNDLTVNWLYHSKQNRFYNVSNQPDEDDLFNTTWRPMVNVVNVEMGQHVNFGEVKNIRFHAGVQILSLSSESHVNFIENPIERNYREVEYIGIGPRSGMDMSYHFGYGFSLYGKAAAAILIGKNKMDERAHDQLGSTFTRAEKRGIVPELDARLGFQYAYAMAEGDLSLDVGYMWFNYFNAVHVISAGGVAESDFALNGPYIGLKYVGNV